LNGERIANADLVANPGCYATSVILALAPLLKAGLTDRQRESFPIPSLEYRARARSPRPARTSSRWLTIFLRTPYLTTGMWEMMEQLHLNLHELTFTPHLLPFREDPVDDLRAPQPRTEILRSGVCFRDFYSASAGSGFLRHRSFRSAVFAAYQLLRSRILSGGDGRRLVLISCVDNLLKGAAGQACRT